MMERVELHSHSYYSGQDGAVHSWEIAEYAKECGMTAFALTDTDTVLGFPGVRWEAERHEIKPIYGIELDGKTVLIQKQSGKRVLYKLFSENSRQGDNKLYEMLQEQREHFLMGSGNIYADLSQMILQKASENDIAALAKQYDFIEIQPHTCYLSLINSDAYVSISGEQDLIDLNLHLLEIGERHKIPVVATSNSYYINDDDKLCRDIIRSRAGLEMADSNSDQHFRNTQEMLAEFPYLSEEKAYEVVVTNTNKFANLCSEIDLISTDEQYPRKKTDAKELDDLCTLALQKKYGDNVPEEIQHRVTWELEALHYTGMEFIILYLYRMLQELQIKPYQKGFRGLVGNVYVCYLLGITDVDSIKYHLDPYFALGYNQNKLIDIDMNFSERHREEARDFYMRDEDLHAIPGCLMNMYREDSEEIIEEYERQKGVELDDEQRIRLSSRISSLYVNSSVENHEMLMIPKNVDIYEYTPVVIDEVGNEVTLYEYYSIDLAFYKQDLLAHSGYDILEELENELGDGPEDFTYEEPEIMNMFVFDDEEDAGCKDINGCRSRFTRMLMKEAKIKNFDGLVKVLGMSHGTGTWIDNAEILLADGKAEIDELIGCREDVYDFLRKHGIEDELAFKITELVRKGIWRRGSNSRQMEYTELMQDAGVPAWFIWSCSKISYLFSRGHAIVYAKMIWRLAWYKLNYPDVFERINEKYSIKFEE